MSSIQKQELVLFSDHSVISQQLFLGEHHNIIFLTHRLGTSSSWLINALVEANILGTPYSLNESSSAATTKTGARSSRDSVKTPVAIASFIHEATHFGASLNKLNIDSSRFEILDLLTDFVARNLGKPSDKILSELLQRFAACSGTILLEQPELLMSLFCISSDELHLKFITPLAKKCSLLVIVSSVEGFDNEFPESSGGFQRDIIEFTKFPITCFHKSIALLSLKPLDTGRAKDVTGTLRIIRGGASAKHLPIHVVENEYLYYTQKESTKLFYR